MWIVVSVHVFLVAFAAIGFYWLLLDIFNRHGGNPKIMLYKAILAFGATVAGLGVSKILIPGYYDGDLGQVSTVSPAVDLVPFFSNMRHILFPTLLVIGLTVLLLTWKHASTLDENPGRKKVYTALVFLGFAISFGLMFLGVLVP